VLLRAARLDWMGPESHDGAIAVVVFVSRVRRCDASVWLRVVQIVTIHDICQRTARLVCKGNSSFRLGVHRGGAFEDRSHALQLWLDVAVRQRPCEASTAPG
jgi:hypothetical protein